MKKTVKFIAMPSRFLHSFGEGVDFSAILRDVLSTHYKLGKEQIDSILAHGRILKDGETTDDVATPDSILKTMNELDKTRVKTLKEAGEKEKFQEGYKKAKGEVLTETETAIKAKYGITSDLKGEDLYEHIISTKLKEAGATSEDEIKKSSTYQALEQRLKKEVKEAVEAGERKYQEFEASVKKEGTFSKVGSSAIEILTGLNPILPTNATVAETYKKDFLNELKGFDYEEKDGKIFVSKDGKLLTDEHGHTLEWETHVKNIAAHRFEFKQNNEGENAGNENDPKKKNAPVKYPKDVKRPTNESELSDVLAKITDTEDKRTVIEEYRKQYGTT